MFCRAENTAITKIMLFTEATKPYTHFFNKKPVYKKLGLQRAKN